MEAFPKIAKLIALIKSGKAAAMSEEMLPKKVPRSVVWVEKSSESFAEKSQPESLLEALCRAQSPFKTCCGLLSKMRRLICGNGR